MDIYDILAELADIQDDLQNSRSGEIYDGIVSDINYRHPSNEIAQIYIKIADNIDNLVEKECSFDWDNLLNCLVNFDNNNDNVKVRKLVQKIKENLSNIK